MKKILSVMLIVFSLLFCCACSDDTSATECGVWWWNSNLDAEKYLSFAQDNSVSEVYYCDAGFDADTKNFIENANDRGIEVYWLAGEYEWLRDSGGLYRQIGQYVDFCTDDPSCGFAGIHLDIEPHQDPKFSEEREFLLESLISLADRLASDFPDIKFDYDIPFWIDDEITFDGVALPAYAHIVNRADRTFIMSYRDTAEAIYDVAKDEIAHAESVGKSLVLGVETYSEEGDKVSFAEEGKHVMYAEIEKLKAFIPENFGIAVHQIKTWYDLKD